MSSLLDQIALAAAEKIWRTAGPRAGMIAYRNLLSQDSNATRAQAILRGIDCAMEAGDEQSAFTFAEAWGFVLSGDLAEDVVRSAAKLEARGFARTCHLLLSREHERRKDPRVGYALGRVCERRGLPGDALAAFTSCMEHGGSNARTVKESTALRAAATLEVARVRARDPLTATSALELARGLDAAALTPRQKLQHARILLASKSRFERAGALSTLAEVARQKVSLTTPAARVAAAHADRMGHALTPLESDRVVAVLSAMPAPIAALAKKRLESLKNDVGVAASLAEERRIMEDPELLPLVTKAKAILSGASGPAVAAGDVSASLRLADIALAAIAEHRRGALRVTRLRELTSLAADDVRPFPRSPLTLCMLALSSDDRLLHADAAALASRAIALGAASPRGMVALAALLIARGEEAVAERALRLAAQRDEPSAEAHLVRLLCHRARMAHGSGDRATALACLTEARAHHLSKRPRP